jgi:hypothetical protein
LCKKKGGGCGVEGTVAISYHDKVGLSDKSEISR